jgi:AcrR family transcriptional regulator
MARQFDEGKKSAIMNAALGLITSNGFDATPVSAIAREAGVAAGTIYTYFPSKQELIKELYLANKELLTDFVVRDLDVTFPAKETIKRIWKNHVAYVLLHPLEFCFLEQFANSPHIDRLTKEQGCRIVKPVVDQFDRAKREGAIRNLPTEMIHIHLFAPVNALVKQYRSDGFDLTAERIELIFETSWKAISMEQSHLRLGNRKPHPIMSRPVEQGGVGSVNGQSDGERSGTSSITH